MKKIFWIKFKKIIIIFLLLNMALGRPVFAVVAPEPPTPPSAPQAPTAPTPPSAPTPPTAPEPPASAIGTSPSASPAPTNEATNTQTGSGSTNENSITNENNVSVTNENNGTVVNESNNQVLTGGNSASYNTGGGQITTGDALQSLQIVTNLNQNTNLISANDSPLNNQAGNGLTGANSQNNSEITNKLNEAINNNNTGNLTNKLLVNSVSGQNFSSYNTGNGTVKTGDAIANLSLISAVNTNVTGTGGMKTFNIFDKQQGNLVFTMNDFKDGAQFTTGNAVPSYQTSSKTVAENSTTGADSTNTSKVTDTTNNTTQNTNQGTLNNEITINAISGDNNGVKNTGSADVTTGDASAVGTLVNFLNNNFNVSEWMIGVVNIFGELIGDIVLPKNDTTASNSQQQIAANSTTGADSTNTANINNQTTANFSNYNDAKVLNKIETTAVTGANTASYNTGPGQVDNGDAAVNVQEVTLANNNAIGDAAETYWLVLVNKLGQWVGEIVGSSGQTIAGNLTFAQTTPEFTNGNTEKLEAVGNEATGAGSVNEATASATQNLAIENKNQGNLENNIKITADSGNNSSSYNTLGGDITTGNADVGLSLVNFVNNNLVGKKLIVLVVDVIGKWIGDVVPPDEEKKADQEAQNSAGTAGGVDLPNVTQDNSQNNSSGYNQDSFTAVYNEEPQTSSQDLLVDQAYFDQSYLNFRPFAKSETEEENIRLARGFFASTVFAREASDKEEGSPKTDITADWLYFLFPSLFGIVVARNKKIRTFLFSFL